MGLTENAQCETVSSLIVARPASRHRSTQVRKDAPHESSRGNAARAYFRMRSTSRAGARRGRRFARGRFGGNRSRQAGRRERCRPDDAKHGSGDDVARSNGITWRSPVTGGLRAVSGSSVVSGDHPRRVKFTRSGSSVSGDGPVNAFNAGCPVGSSDAGCPVRPLNAQRPLAAR